MNPTSMQTKEMGPGARHDALNRHLQGFNWTRTTNMGEFGFLMQNKVYECSEGATLGKRLKEAELQSAKQRAAADELESAFTTESVGGTGEADLLSIGTCS